jgi:hypothetical protein
MRERNGAPVSDAQAEEVLDWLISYRSFSDSWMFRAKCLRCHGVHHLTKTPRTAEEWSDIVDRVAWLSPFAYRVDQRDQVKAHLADALSVPVPEPGSVDHESYVMRRDLRAACNPCHSISLIFEDGVLDDANAMVARMSRKDPKLVPEDRIDDFAEAVKALAKDPDEFDRLFPHDVLLEVGP